MHEKNMKKNLSILNGVDRFFVENPAALGLIFTDCNSLRSQSMAIADSPRFQLDWAFDAIIVVEAWKS